MRQDATDQMSKTERMGNQRDQLNQGSSIAVNQPTSKFGPNRMTKSIGQEDVQNQNMDLPKP